MAEQPVTPAPNDVQADDLVAAGAICREALQPLLDADWSVPARDLAWDCRRTLDHIADALERLEIANAGAKLHIFMSPRDWANLRTAKDSQTRYQLSPDPTQDARRQLFGTPVSVSSQIPSNLGAGANESWILVCDMNQIAIGRRLSLIHI